MVVTASAAVTVTVIVFEPTIKPDVPLMPVTVASGSAAVATTVSLVTLFDTITA